jgi:hypothetical protein
MQISSLNNQARIVLIRNSEISKKIMVSQIFKNNDTLMKGLRSYSTLHNVKINMKKI